MYEEGEENLRIVKKQKPIILDKNDKFIILKIHTTCGKLFSRAIIS